MATEKDKDISDSNEIGTSTDPAPAQPADSVDKPTESTDASRPHTSVVSREMTEDVAVGQPTEDLGVRDDSETQSAKSNITEILEYISKPDLPTISDDTTKIVAEADSTLPASPLATPATAETTEVTDQADLAPAPSKTSSPSSPDTDETQSDITDDSLDNSSVQDHDSGSDAVSRSAPSTAEPAAPKTDDSSQTIIAPAESKPTEPENEVLAIDGLPAAEVTAVVDRKPDRPKQTPTPEPVEPTQPTTSTSLNEPTEKLVTPTPTSQPPTPASAPLGSSFKTKKGGKGKLVALLLVPILLLAAFFGAWAFDHNSRGEKVSRNTEINGVDISGLSGEELSAGISNATDDVLDVDLTVNANGDSIVTSPRALGAEPDIETTTQDALASRRSGFVLARPFSWASSFLRTDQVAATYIVDQNAADKASQTIFEPIMKPVIETSIELRGSGFIVIPGTNGERIEATEIEAELPDALTGPQRPVLELTPVAGVPQISEADATAAADEAASALDEPLEIQLLDDTATAEPTELLRMVALDNSDGEVTWIIDNELAVVELKKKFISVGTNADEASFSIVNDKPVVIPVASAVECCDDTTGQRIKEAALERSAESEFVVVEPEFVDEDPTADELNSYGIIEEISSFTTPHAAGGPRVTNIQRFADLIQGTVIEVGEELSLNEAVGERTIGKGFVADGAINEGVIEQQIGGGISQFATTFFNASFFSGIEIQEHQFHTLAIGSRYPLGRESTIDFPSVDVRVKNTSEHPILIGTSYTSTSITVTFYSQKHLTIRDVNGDELAFDVYQQGRDSTFPPSIGSDRECSVYTTQRFTEFPDGEIVEDSFSGFYRPGEGLDCDGELTPKAQAELDAENEAENETENEANNN